MGRAKSQPPPNGSPTQTKYSTHLYSSTSRDAEKNPQRQGMERAVLVSIFDYYYHSKLPITHTSKRQEQERKNRDAAVAVVEHETSIHNTPNSATRCIQHGPERVVKRVMRTRVVTVHHGVHLNSVQCTRPRLQTARHMQ